MDIGVLVRRRLNAICEEALGGGLVYMGGILEIMSSLCVLLGEKGVIIGECVRGQAKDFIMEYKFLEIKDKEITGDVRFCLLYLWMGFFPLFIGISFFKHVSC